MTQVRKLPLWARYVIAFGSAAVLFAALVVFVSHNQQPLAETPAPPNRSQLAAEQHQDRIVVEQQQAPHVIAATAGVTPARAAAAAVGAYMRAEVSRSLIAGPADGRPRCVGGAAAGGRRFLRCRADAGRGATRLTYPFDVVIAAGTLTYCQVVTPPIPTLRVPVVRACR